MALVIVVVSVAYEAVACRDILIESGVDDGTARIQVCLHHIQPFIIRER